MAIAPALPGNDRDETIGTRHPTLASFLGSPTRAAPFWPCSA